MDALNSLLYPRLDSFPADERANALRHARETSFDVIELIGIAAGLVLVTAITRYQLDTSSAAEGFLRAIGNFVVALPLLAIFVGPFLVRRVRRGLDRELAKRGPQ
jgi:hypothetical protein